MLARGSNVSVKVKRLDKNIDLPAYTRSHDAGLDLRSREEVVIDPGEKAIINTGLQVAIPPGHVGLIWDRSGLAAKHALKTMAGVIDAGYRGEIGVVMTNLGKSSFKVDKNMRIAQLIVQPYITASISEVEELDDTERGANNFGSSGTS